MNIKMLKYLVDHTDDENDCADTDDFFKHFPKNAATLNDLRALASMRYISILDADDDIDTIAVAPKAHNYFK